MRTILVTTDARDLALDLDPSIAQVVTARAYLCDADWLKERYVRVINLCRSYRYQSEGYYVSLLAAARRHRPFPDLRVVLDMGARHAVRTIDEDLEQQIQRNLKDLASDRFVLSIYFGQNLAERHARLANRLFQQFPAPLLRAQFERDGRWHLTRIEPIAWHDVPAAHRSFAADAAVRYLQRRAPAQPGARRVRPLYDLAILQDPNEQLAPSDDLALQRFERAARATGFRVERIQKHDFGRLLEFDALFLRETTTVDHHTFRFAQRAEANGMVVVDDPTSILRCTNKVFQAEALRLRSVPTPRTRITADAAADADLIRDEIGFPCVLKSPDSSFSQGVVKCRDQDELLTESRRFLAHSDLVLVQEYLPTDFDWRVGLFDGEPLFACRYLMASGHWQIVKKTGGGRYRYGQVQPVPLEEVPPTVVRVAQRAAATIGNGLYGVDVKVSGRRTVVTEVNDNPNINAGCEDKILKQELYLRIARGFLSRLEQRRPLRRSEA